MYVGKPEVNVAACKALGARCDYPIIVGEWGSFVFVYSTRETVAKRLKIMNREQSIVWRT